MNFSKLFFAVAIGLLISSCGSDDEVINTSCVQDAFTSGIMIVNEGQFTSGSGSLSLIDDALGQIDNAYSRNNCDSLLGSVVQSATLIGNKLAIVVNNSNKVRVLDAATLEELGVITGLALPRYLVAGAGDLAYVSQWGSDGLSGSVAEVNLADFSIMREVATGSGPEELQLKDNMLYVPHKGGYGMDSTLVVVDATSMTVTKTYVTGINPQSLVFENDNIWVLNGGAFDFIDPALNLPGSLVKITGDQISEELAVSTGATDLAFSSPAATFYWSSGNGIASFTIGSSASSTVYPGFFYSLDIDPSDGVLYFCDAKDFNSIGDLLSFDPAAGGMAEIVSVGIIPGEVIFY